MERYGEALKSPAQRAKEAEEAAKRAAASDEQQHV